MKKARITSSPIKLPEGEKTPTDWQPEIYRFKKKKNANMSFSQDVYDMKYDYDSSKKNASKTQEALASSCAKVFNVVESLHQMSDHASTAMTL